MKKTLLKAFALALTVCLPAKLESAMTIAVFPMDAPKGPLEERGKAMASLIEVDLSATEGLLVVERAKIDEILGEQGFALSGLADPASAAKAGKLLGANVLITGRLIATGDSTVAAAKVIGVETGRAFAMKTDFQGETGIQTAATQLSKAISTTLAEKSEALVGQPESREAMIRRLTALIPKGGSNLSVTVTIPEEHINSPVPDPAAQTEIMKTLQELGFSVLVGDQRKNADIEIKGEGFSELAMRKANLIACRARVETEVIRRKDGALLLADRETASAVDTSEHIAAKLALQAASLELLERILPKLAP